LVIPDALYQFQVTLSSDGDFPLNLEASSVFTDCRTCYYNNTSGSATIVSTTDPNDCTHVMAASVSAGTPGIPVGTACTFTILYDPNSPTTLRTGSGQGLAYTDLTLALTTDAGSLPAWGQQYTITGVPQFDE